MTPLEELLHRRWILKSEDSDCYYRIKDALKDIRKVMQEKLGYIIVVNPYLIKLEKIPGKAECWMGIQDFKTIQEYQMFCYLLMFLEDKEREYQFVLSSLTEYIQAQFPQGEVEWVNISARRRFIRVIKYALSIGILLHYSDDEDQFAQDEKTEVLFENTGASRYYMRNFMKELMDYQTPEDFDRSEWISMDEDRGIVRRQRIYRRLLLSAGVYREDQDDDFLYIRNYRNQIQADFQTFFPCDLHIHKSSAYVNLMDNCSMGNTFPSRNALSDVILLVHHELFRRIKNGQLMMENNEKITMEYPIFLNLCARIIQKNIDKMPKKFQDEGNQQVAKLVLESMYNYGFIDDDSNKQILYINPIVGKLIGNYRESGVL